MEREKKFKLSQQMVRDRVQEQLKRINRKAGGIDLP